MGVIDDTMKTLEEMKVKYNPQVETGGLAGILRRGGRYDTIPYGPGGEAIPGNRVADMTMGARKPAAVNIGQTGQPVLNPAAPPKEVKPVSTTATKSAEPAEKPVESPWYKQGGWGVINRGPGMNPVAERQRREGNTFFIEGREIPELAKTPEQLQNERLASRGFGSTAEEQIWKIRNDPSSYKGGIFSGKGLKKTAVAAIAEIQKAATGAEAETGRARVAAEAKKSDMVLDQAKHNLEVQKFIRANDMTLPENQMELAVKIAPKKKVVDPNTGEETTTPDMAKGMRMVRSLLGFEKNKLSVWEQRDGSWVSE